MEKIFYYHFYRNGMVVIRQILTAGSGTGFSVALVTEHELPINRAPYIKIYIADNFVMHEIIYVQYNL